MSRVADRARFCGFAAALRQPLQTRQPLTEAEVAEIAELRKRIRRADADAVMLLVIESRPRGGLLFF